MNNTVEIGEEYYREARREAHNEESRAKMCGMKLVAVWAGLLAASCLIWYGLAILFIRAI